VSKEKPSSFSPYFRAEDADQVRAAFEAVGKQENHSSISELIEAATLRELKRLQRKYNGGKPWPGVPASPGRAGRPRKQD
jgi:hypothetical protein